MSDPPALIRTHRFFIFKDLYMLLYREKLSRGETFASSKKREIFGINFRESRIKSFSRTINFRDLKKFWQDVYQTRPKIVIKRSSLGFSPDLSISRGINFREFTLQLVSRGFTFAKMAKKNNAKVSPRESFSL